MFWWGAIRKELTGWDVEENVREEEKEREAERKGEREISFDCLLCGR